MERNRGDKRKNRKKKRTEKKHRRINHIEIEIQKEINIKVSGLGWTYSEHSRFMLGTKKNNSVACASIKRSEKRESIQE